MTKQTTKQGAVNTAQTLAGSLEKEQTNAGTGLLMEISMTDEKVFNINDYDFLNTNSPAPDSVHPNLWEQAKLNMNYGLFRVNNIKSDNMTARQDKTFSVEKGDVFQIRGCDLANMTIVYDGEGWIVMDCLTVVETAGFAWKEIVQTYLPTEHPKIKLVVYSHSHIDHYGGIGGLKDFFATDQSGQPDYSIIAPEGFLQHAISENVYAGAAMQRRSLYQYGTNLHVCEKGQVDAGLGKRVASGRSSIIPPTHEFTFGEYLSGKNYIEIDTKTYGRNTDNLPDKANGIRLQIQLTPGTEAPAEMNVYLPDYNVLFIAENCAGTLHNLLTPRGAQVRDPLAWANYLDQTLTTFTGIKIVCSAHNWPHRNQEKNGVNDYGAIRFIEIQRDMYRYLNNAVLRLVNLGYTIDEVGRMITNGEVPLPKDFDNEWCCHGFYGTLNHDAKAVYQRYIGWFDGNPAHLNRHKPTDQATRYVKAFGFSNIYGEAQKAAERGDFTWAAELLHYLMNADKTSQNDAFDDVFGKAKELYSRVLTQMGFQSEAASWRNMYLAGAEDINQYDPNKTPADPTYQQLSDDTVNAMNLEMALQYLGIRFDGNAYDADLKPTDSPVTMAFETKTPDPDDPTKTCSEYADVKAMRGVLDYRIQPTENATDFKNAKFVFRGTRLEVFRAIADQKADALKDVLKTDNLSEAATFIAKYFQPFRLDFPIMTPRPQFKKLLLTQITIYWGAIVDFLQVTFDQNDTRSAGSAWTLPNELKINLENDPVVKVTGVSSVSYAGKTAISQLTFYTKSGNTFGPCGGWDNDTKFTLEQPGYIINGFFGAFATGGRTSPSKEPDQFMTQFGVYFATEAAPANLTASLPVGKEYDANHKFDFKPQK